MSKSHRYATTLTWTGNAGEGTASYRSYERAYEVAAEGKPALLGSSDPSFRGDPARWNPEELLLAALGACFVNTWAIFVKKLNLNHEALALDVSGELGQDPAGGYRMERALIRASVPATLLAENRAGVEKSLALAEKYCIISKVVRASMELRVEIQEA